MTISIDDKLLTDFGIFNADAGYKGERVLICEQILRKNKPTCVQNII